MSAAGGRIELPWPPKELSPNARVHFRAKAAATKAYREQAYWTAKTAYMRGELTRSELPAEGVISLRFEFRPPDARRRDLDNMLSSMKAGLDGIADALEVNDQRFELFLKRSTPIKGGKIIVEVAGG